MVSCRPGWPQNTYITKGDGEPAYLRPPHRLMGCRNQTRAACMLGKHSTSCATHHWAHTPLLFVFYTYKPIIKFNLQFGEVRDGH